MLDNYSKSLMTIGAMTFAVIIGFGIFLYNRKPETSPPPVLPIADESLQRTQQRSFVNFINVFQAEDYDIGGPEVAFHFAAKELKSGNGYRTDAVNIFPGPKEGYYLGNLHSGDWVNYTLSVPTDGNYLLRVKGAGGPEDAVYAIVLNGRTLAEFNIPKASEKNPPFVNVDSKAFDLPAGQHTLQIVMKQGSDGRLDWYRGVRIKEIEPRPPVSVR